MFPFINNYSSLKEKTYAVPTISNGNKKTAIFDASDDWKIVWSCDPSSFYGGEYNLIVSVYASDGSDVDLAAINTICKTGNTHDLTEEHQGGQVYLDIASEGAWAIQI